VTVVRISELIFNYSNHIHTLLSLYRQDFKKDLPATAKNNLIKTYKLLKECCRIIDDVIGVEEVR